MRKRYRKIEVSFSTAGAGSYFWRQDEGNCGSDMTASRADRPKKHQGYAVSGIGTLRCKHSVALCLVDVAGSFLG